VDALNWRKASYSASNGGCVEVAGHADHVLVRDTRDRSGPVLRFGPAAWCRFADQVKRSLAFGPSRKAESARFMYGSAFASRGAPFCVPGVVSSLAAVGDDRGVGGAVC
jgi:hypothetical protein